jgi:hypothetical protein
MIEHPAPFGTPRNDERTTRVRSFAETVLVV